MSIQAHALQSFVVGDDWSIAGTLSDQFGNPFDPTNATSITWKLDDETGRTNYVTLTLGSGVSIGTIPAWTVPVVLIAVPAATTNTLLPGTYRDQLRLVIGGLTQTMWFGPIQVLQSI